jgi:hypothetical protein
MKGVGASLLEQKFASRTDLKATIHQTEQVITVATRGRGFALDLINEGKTEDAVFTLKLNAEPDRISAHQIWPKQA